MPRVIVGCTEAQARRIRSLGAAVYDEARARQWPFLSDVLQRALRGASEEEAAATAALAHALVKYDRLLAFATQSDRSDARIDALFAMTRGGPAVTDARVERIESRTERLGVLFSMPDWLVEHLEAELGESAALRAFARMNELAPRVARVNGARTTRENALLALEAEAVTARPVARSAYGIVVESHRSLFRTDVFARGYVEMQDEASQLVAELVAPPPRTFVVDACAGAGGKTLALAALLRGKGQVLALDASEARLAQLRRRARRAEASNVRAVACDLLDAAALRGHAERAGSLAQRVLLDAPCSGLGAIRRNPELRWRLRPGELNRLLDLQQALARAAATLVLPHGRLVFATCSFLPSEGERAFDRFLQENADYVSVSVRDVLGRTRTEGVATNDGRYLRTWRFDGTPDGGDEGMDGFFAGVARRRAQPSSGGP